MSTTFTGPDQVGRYRAIVMAQALSLYAKTGMKANRAYTPSAMIAAAREITGKHFRARAYEEAAQALRDWAQRPPE
jgi:hypothetical protein